MVIYVEKYRFAGRQDLNTKWHQNFFCVRILIIYPTIGAHFISSNWKICRIELFQKMLVNLYQFQMCLTRVAMKQDRSKPYYEGTYTDQ